MSSQVVRYGDTFIHFGDVRYTHALGSGGIEVGMRYGKSVYLRGKVADEFRKWLNQLPEGSFSWDEVML
jgi:hypothetical protein